MEEQLHANAGTVQLQTFLSNEAGLSLDNGNDAVTSFRGQLWTPNNNGGTTETFVNEDGRSLHNGLIELYGPDTSPPLDTLATVMSGSFAVASLTPEMSMPAIIATSNKQSVGSLTLYMMQKRWRNSGLTQDQEALLAASAQLETPDAGKHLPAGSTSAEAQHLLTQFSITDKPALLEQWQQGTHVNHDPHFVGRGTMASVSGTIFPSHKILTARIRRNPAGSTELSLNDSPYKPAPYFTLRWHQESMSADNEQGVKVGDHSQALVVAQGAGFLAIKHNLPMLRRTLAT